MRSMLPRVRTDQCVTARVEIASNVATKEAEGKVPSKPDSFPIPERNGRPRNDHPFLDIWSMPAMSESIVPNSTGQDQPSDKAVDPFNPENLRLSQDFGATLGVKKVLTTVRCDKPNRQVFCRVRPGEEWRLDTGIFEDKVNRGERYLVDRDLWGELAGEIVPATLLTAVTKQNDLFLWPIKLPGPDGRSNEWNDSALAAARLAETRWVRMAANMQAGPYDVFEACGELADPVWPDLTFPEILRLAFKDRFIQDLDRAVLKALRGEA